MPRLAQFVIPLSFASKWLTLVRFFLAIFWQAERKPGPFLIQRKFKPTTVIFRAMP